MNDDQIKEILIALINNGQIVTGLDNKSIAENMALFINTLKQELNEKSPLGETLAPEEIAKRVGIDLDIPVITPE